MLQFKKGPPFKEDDCTLPVLLDYDFITLQVQKVRIDTQKNSPLPLRFLCPCPDKDSKLNILVQN